MGEKKNGSGEKKKEEKSPITVVLKVDFHCDGCASKIVKYLRSLEDVDTVKTDTSSNKLTVAGTVDPSVIKEKLHQKTKKKVDLISPQPKKEDKKDGKEEKKEKKEKKDNKNGDSEKKPKEPPVTTAVLKVAFHCHGCIDKIRKIVSKTKGVQDMSLDKQKELVTVKGTMDAKALAETLKDRLKRSVEVVPSKKEKEDGGKGGGGDAGGGKKKKNGGGGGGDGGKEETKLEGSRMEHMGVPGFGFGYGYENPHMMPGYPVPGYAPGYPVHLHPPQMFSDENPNAYCSIM